MLRLKIQFAGFYRLLLIARLQQRGCRASLETFLGIERYFARRILGATTCFAATVGTGSECRVQSPYPVTRGSETLLDACAFISYQDRLSLLIFVQLDCLGGNFAGQGARRRLVLMLLREAMAKACVKNILNLANGKPFKKVYDTKKKPFLPVIITLGRKQGVANVPWANNWLGRWLKAPAMITPMLWGNFGVKGFVLSAAAKGPSPITTPA